jgi:hypothetical protein
VTPAPYFDPNDPEYAKSKINGTSNVEFAIEVQ